MWLRVRHVRLLYKFFESLHHVTCLKHMTVFLKILFLEIVERFKMRVMDTHYTFRDVTGQKLNVRNDSDNMFTRTIC